MRTIEHSGQMWLHLGDYIDHLDSAIGMVRLMSEGVEDSDAGTVIATLGVQRNSLQTMLDRGADNG